MKVAFFVDTLSIEKGTGIARYSNRLLNGLRDAGLDVECISAANSDATNVGMFDHAVRLPSIVFKKRNSFDIFHASSPVTGLGLRLTRKPKIVTYHDIASILYAPEAKTHVRMLAPYFYKMGKYCDKIICVSSQTKTEIMDYFNFPEEKIIVINHGIDENLYPMSKGRNEIPVIGYIGSMSPRKRIDYLIRAAYHLKKSNILNFRLAICGKKSSYYPQLQGLIDSLGLSKDVEFRGFIPDDQLNNTYNSFDAMVIPSEWEGFGIPILEAQKCGVPVIIRKDAHIPAEVSRCCLKSMSEQDMADQIACILKDETMYNSISKNGIDYSNTFTWNKMISQTINVYKEAL